MPKRPRPSWQHRHEPVLLWILQNPTKTLKQCAQQTGYSQSHISRIFNSPDFQRRYRAARNIISEGISRSVINRW